MLYLLFLLACVSANQLSLKILKKVSIIRYVIEETYYIEGLNEGQQALNKFTFRTLPEFYDKLKVFVFQDADNNQHIQTTISQNYFKLEFPRPIEPNGIFHIRINFYLYNQLIF